MYWKEFLKPNKPKIILFIVLLPIIYLVLTILNSNAETGVDEFESKALNELRLLCSEIKTGEACETADFINNRLLKEPDGFTDCKWFNNECETILGVGGVLKPIFPYSIIILLSLLISYIFSAVIIEFSKK